MAYDYFSQPQGPAIPISLFGDASNAGINGGNAQKTPLQAGLEGAISGVEQGEKIVAGAQQIALTQNRIENLPTENAQNEEQLKSSQIANDVNGLKRDILLNNKELVERQQKAELELQAQESTTKLNTLKTRDEITGLLASNDPAEKLKIISDPRLGQVLMQDSKFAEGVIGQLYPIMSENQKQNAMAALDFSKQREFDARKKEAGDAQLNAVASKKTESFWKVQGNVELSPVMDEIGTDASNIQVKPKSTVRKNADGSAALDKNGNTQIDITPKEWEVYNNGKLLKTTIKSEVAANTLQGYANSSKAYDTLSRQDLNLKPKVDTATVVTKASQNSNVPTFGNQPAAQSQPNAPQGNTVEERLAQKRQAIREKMMSAKQGSEAGNIQNQVDSTTQTPEQVTSSATETPSTATNTPETAPATSTSTPVPAPGIKQALAVKTPVPEVLQGYAPIVQAVSYVESSFKSSSLSNKDAHGLMQILPGTFKDVVRRYGLGDKDIHNDKDNVEVGSLYLAEQIKNFGSEPGNGLELALAAYNTGPGRVKDALDLAIANGNPSWDGVKIELKKMLNPKAYDEVSKYPGKVLKVLSA